MGYNATGQYVNERTGNTWATEAMSIAMDGPDTGYHPAVEQPAIIIPVSASSPGGLDTRARDAAGNLTTNQTNSSQYWMNAGYTGAEPDLSVKALYSDAQYAYDNAVKIAQAAVVQYTPAAVNPAVVTLAAAAPVAAYSGAALSQSVSDLTDQFSGLFNSAIDFLSKNLLYIVIFVAAIVVVPGLIRAASGRRAR